MGYISEVRLVTAATMAAIAVLVGKDGQVRIYDLIDDGTTVVGTERRRFAVGSQSEGCVQDDQNDGGAQNFKLLGWREILAALGMR